MPSTDLFEPCGNDSGTFARRRAHGHALALAPIALPLRIESACKSYYDDLTVKVGEMTKRLGASRQYPWKQPEIR